MIRAVEQRADLAGFAVFLADTDEEPAREDLLVTRLAKQVDGFIIASSRLTEPDIRAHAGRNPVVLVNRDISGIARVLIDTTRGVTPAVEHLAEFGAQSARVPRGSQSRVVERAAQAHGEEGSRSGRGRDRDDAGWPLVVRVGSRCRIGDPGRRR